MLSGGLNVEAAKKPSAEQRKALGSFLANRRSRLSPRELGLPYDKRRTPGLRREEVASLAGVSVSWYTWLEQGRDIQASAAMLRRLSDVLRLDRVETAHLFALASREPPSFVPDERITEGMTALVSALDPRPACVRNPRLDILAWNAAEADLFGDYGALRPHERNTLRLLFLHGPYRALFASWEQVARDTIATFRAAHARAQDKSPFDKLAKELREVSPEFREWWPEVEVRGFEEGQLQLRHPRHGLMDLTYISLAPEGRPTLLLTICTARPQASASLSSGSELDTCPAHLCDHGHAAESAASFA